MQNGICPALFLAYYPDCNVSTAILILIVTQTNALKDGLRLRPIKNQECVNECLKWPEKPAAVVPDTITEISLHRRP